MPRRLPDLRPARALLRIALALALLAPLAGCTDLKRFCYEGFGRDRWQQPERVVQALALEPGDRVTDLGSGGGYFSFRLARAVGPNGRVYAVDVDEALNDYVRRRAESEGLANLEVVLAEPSDPKLLASSVDVLLTVNTYHHLSDRSRYFANLRPALRPGARVAIIDFDAPGWLRRHYTPAETIEREMEQAGYRLQQRHDFLSRQSFLVFAVAAE